jgi:FkbM family methyltransferase
MPGGLSSDNKIVWEYIDQHESEFLYHEIFVNESYFHGLGITLKEGDVVVDAGANIGLFSLFCLSLNPKIKICAFEPILPIFQVLQRNLSSYFHSSSIRQHSRQQQNPQNRQDEDNLILFNAALGSSNEPQQLFYYFPSAPGESTRHIQERNQQKIRIQQLIRSCPDPLLHDILPTERELKRKISAMEPPDITRSRGYLDSQTCYADVVTLPTAMKEAFGENWTIDLLKIDVEGDEWNILLGLLIDDNQKVTPGTQSPPTPLIHRIRQIVLEVHDQPLETQSMITHRRGRLDHIVEFLRFYGFTVSVEQQLSKVTDPLSLVLLYSPPPHPSPNLGLRRNRLLYVHPL